MPFNAEKYNKLISQKPVSQTGGKGSVRRKHKAVRKGGLHDDKRLKATLNKLSVRDIPAIEEVNLFKDDGTVIHFVNPKVQASIAANTYVVAGQAENKKLQDLLPGIITQLGHDNLNELKKIYQAFAAQGGLGGDKGAGANVKVDDDDVPDLLENFEEVANKGNKEANTANTDKDKK